MLAECGFKAKKFELIPDEARTRNILHALKVLVHSLQATQPLLLYFDDLHWADAYFIVLLDKLGDSLPGMGLLICCTARLDLK